MGVFSDYLEAALLNHVLNAVAYSAPASVYIGLLTAAPSDSGGGTEVTGGSYARVQMTAGWTVTSGDGIAKNTGAVTFPSPSAPWGTITHIGIYDASSGGNLLIWGPLQSTKQVASGDVVRFLANQLQVSLD